MTLASIQDLDQPSDKLEPYLDLAKTLGRQYYDFLSTFKEDGHRAPGIHASELCKCLRQTWYSLRSEPKHEEIDATWRKRFEVGHSLHDMVQRHFLRMAAQAQAAEMARENGWYLEFESEVKVHPERQALAATYDLHSSADGVFTFRDLSRTQVVLRVGLEIKTESPDGYAKLNAPKADHVQQAHVYMAALDLPLMWFFYFNKGNQNNTPSSTPWLITFQPSVWAHLETRARTVLMCSETNQVPEREEGGHCSFCPYVPSCQPASQSRAGRSQARPFQSVRRSQ